MSRVKFVVEIIIPAEFSNPILQSQIAPFCFNAQTDLLPGLPCSHLHLQLCLFSLSSARVHAAAAPLALVVATGGGGYWNFRRRS